MRPGYLPPARTRKASDYRRKPGIVNEIGENCKENRHIACERRGRHNRRQPRSGQIGEKESRQCGKRHPPRGAAQLAAGYGLVHVRIIVVPVTDAAARIP